MKKEMLVFAVSLFLLLIALVLSAVLMVRGEAIGDILFFLALIVWIIIYFLQFKVEPWKVRRLPMDFSDHVENGR